MAANIGSMSAQLSLSMGNFSRGLSQARTQLGTFGASVSAMSVRSRAAFDRISTAASAFGGAVKTGALVAAAAFTATSYAISRSVKTAMEAIDATSKLSDQLGFTTEQLASYQHFADLSGVSSEQLATAFRNMEKRISEAGLGLSQAKRAFEDLGISADELQNMTPDQQIKRIADGFAGLTDQSTRARVALDLFGRSGLGMLTMLEGGGAGLEAAQLEAEKLGIAFNRIEGAKVELALDAITNLKAAFTGIINQIAIALAPAITDITDRITAWATEGEGASAKVSAGIQEVLHWIGQVGDFINRIRQSWYLATEFFLNGLADMYEGFNILGTIAHKIFIGINEIAMTIIKGIVAGFREALNGIVAGFNTIAPKALEMDVIQKGSFEKNIDKMLEDMNEKQKSLKVGLGQSDEANVLRENAKAAGKQADAIASAMPFSQKLTQWWAKANDKAEEAALGQEKKNALLEEELDLEQEKSDLADKEAGFMLTKAGRVVTEPLSAAKTLTPGAVGMGKDGSDAWTEGKVSEQLALLKQMVGKQNTAVFV